MSKFIEITLNEYVHKDHIVSIKFNPDAIDDKDVVCAFTLVSEACCNIFYEDIKENTTALDFCNRFKLKLYE